LLSGLAHLPPGRFLLYDRPKLSKLFHEIDSNHNGTVEWEEMLAFITERAATYQKK
jgi:Ca2+-binding EF-hand superfamily protein